MCQTNGQPKSRRPAARDAPISVVPRGIARSGAQDRCAAHPARHGAYRDGGIHRLYHQPQGESGAVRPLLRARISTGDLREHQAGRVLFPRRALQTRRRWIHRLRRQGTHCGLHPTVQSGGGEPTQALAGATISLTKVRRRPYPPAPIERATLQHTLSRARFEHPVAPQCAGHRHLNGLRASCYV